MSQDERDRYLERIGELFERASYRQALSVCERALVAHPGCAEAHDYRGLILCRMGRYREALPSYDRALSLEPDFVPALLDKAELLVFYLGEPEIALALADRVLRLAASDLDRAHAAYIKGVAWANLDEHDEAIANYDESLSWDVEHPDAHCERGVSLYESYRFSEALRELKTACQLDPRHARPHHYLGCIYEFMGETDLAVREFEQAGTLDAESYPAPLRLATDDFARAVQEAVHTLPREVTRLLAEIDLERELLPDRTHLAEGIVRPSAQAWIGIGESARPVIVLHQRNFERACRSRGELVEEVAHAIAHQLGHPEHREG